MSVGIEARLPACACCGHRPEGESLNVTYNVSPMLRAAGITWRDYDGVTAPEFARSILERLDVMAQDPERWRAMNPENGWGDYDRTVQGRVRDFAILLRDDPQYAKATMVID